MRTLSTASERDLPLCCRIDTVELSQSPYFSNTRFQLLSLYTCFSVTGFLLHIAAFSFWVFFIRKKSCFKDSFSKLFTLDFCHWFPTLVLWAVYILSCCDINKNNISFKNKLKIRCYSKKMMLMFLFQNLWCILLSFSVEELLYLVLVVCYTVEQVPLLWLFDVWYYMRQCLGCKPPLGYMSPIIFLHFCAWRMESRSEKPR